MKVERTTPVAPMPTPSPSPPTKKIRIHPFTKFRKKENRNKPPEEKLLDCMDYLKATEPFCRRFHGTRKGQSQFTTCDCLRILRDDACVVVGDEKDTGSTTATTTTPSSSAGNGCRDREREAVARFMLMFYDQPKAEKQRMLMAWIRCTGAIYGRRKFLIPFVALDKDAAFDPTGHEHENNNNNNNKIVAELRSYRVCKAAIGYLLRLSKHSWGTCQKAVETNTIPQHGNKHKRPGNARKFDTEVYDDLVAFFEKMKQLGTPRRLLPGDDACENGDDNVVVELPTHLSKRGMYNRFCSERGWKLKTSAAGNITYEKQDDNAKAICVWATFCRFWNKDYPTIRLGKPASTNNNSTTTEHNGGADPGAKERATTEPSPQKGSGAHPKKVTPTKAAPKRLQAPAALAPSPKRARVAGD